ncbi:hypothetical protein SH139x_002995 [Planctomycetaceae bacterium SH139]
MSTVRIITGSRLHFGLLDTRVPFGGVGIMIDQPRTVVRVTAANLPPTADTPSLEVAAEDDVSGRVRQVLQRFCEHAGSREMLTTRVWVDERPHSHTGLGTGTQLALAVAEGLAALYGVKLDKEILATQVAGRGQRSAVGIHGYWQGGLVYEAAKGARGVLNPVACQALLPESWRVVLFAAKHPAVRISGGEEKARFAKLKRPNSVVRGGLKSVLESQLLPALQASDFERFSDAVFQYNLTSGGFFAAVQGGPYQGPQTANFIRRLRAEGVQGIGQSSWGPAVFAFCESSLQAEEVAKLAEQSDFVAQVVRPLNQARSLQFLPGE